MGGRKRHILVDTLGLVQKALVHAANLTDRAAAPALFLAAQPDLPRLELVWADNGYRGPLQEWTRQHLGWWLSIVAQPGGPGQWLRDDQEPPVRTPGFHPLPKRWIVERTFAWLGRYRRLSKDYEYLPATSECVIYAAMIRLMLHRLASGQL